MNLYNKIFVTTLSLGPIAYACQQPPAALQGTLYQSALAFHRKKIYKQEEVELTNVRVKYWEKQEKFKDKLCRIHEAITSAPFYKNQMKVDYEHCYFRQLPIIFYLAKKDYLNELLQRVLADGANPQLEFKIHNDQIIPFTPLMFAQDAKAVENIATLEKAIIRADSLKMLESLEKSFYDRSTVTRYGGRWLSYDDDQPVAQWYKTKRYIESGILKSMQTLCFELVDKPFAAPLVKALIDCGATVDYRQEERSLLGKARAGNQKETVQLLLAKGAKE